MKYYFEKTVNYSFEESVVRVTEELKKEGFGVLTEIDVADTLKKKLDVDFRKYKIWERVTRLSHTKLCKQRIKLE